MSKRHNRKHNKPRDARKRTATASAGSDKAITPPRRSNAPAKPVGLSRAEREAEQAQAFTDSLAENVRRLHVATRDTVMAVDRFMQLAPMLDRAAKRAGEGTLSDLILLERKMIFQLFRTACASISTLSRLAADQPDRTMMFDPTEIGQLALSAGNLTETWLEAWQDTFELLAENPTQDGRTEGK